MICGILVVQYPTDHYQLPAIVEQGIENLQMKPSIISADCIYGTVSNLFYLKQSISVRIPTSEQSNEAIGKKNENKYARNILFLMKNIMFTFVQKNRN